jgi:hypothetical protein
MFYYLVNKIGEGTMLSPFRPDLPIDTPFVREEVGEEQYLVGTSRLVDIEGRIEDIEQFCIDNKISYADVSTWYVGDDG